MRSVWSDVVMLPIDVSPSPQDRNSVHITRFSFSPSLMVFIWPLDNTTGSCFWYSDGVVE